MRRRLSISRLELAISRAEQVEVAVRIMAAAKAQEQLGLVVVSDRPEEAQGGGWGAGRLGGAARGGDTAGHVRGRCEARARHVRGKPHRPSSCIFIERCRCT